MQLLNVVHRFKIAYQYLLQTLANYAVCYYSNSKSVLVHDMKRKGWEYVDT